MLEDNRKADKEPTCALVTGAGRGIGAAVARRLAAAGRPVILVARSEAEIAEQARRIEYDGGRALAFAADLASPGAAQQAVAAATHAFGQPGIVISNAATVHPVEPLLTSDPTQWWRSFEVNVRAAAELLRATVPAMVEAGEGVVVGVSSLLAALPLPGVSAYCASKAAFESLHLSFAAEVAASGVRVATFWPGVVDTVMQAEIRHEPLTVVGNRGPGAQMRTPEEVAEVIYQLVQPDCRATGIRVDIDNVDSMAAAGLEPLVNAVPVGTA